ncbi:MAG: efflux RND transporter periplasmic adaptor subunit [Paraprevotella sp.]|nr:efflux RND transporter periplasmic adaptor subunit [Paraprevotella sp.]
MELKKQYHNVIWALVALVIIIAAVASAGMLLLGHDDESIQGQMEASEYRVSSKVPGRILHLYVKEGDHVKAGDTLAVLEAPDVEAKLSQAEAVEKAAQAIKNKADRGTRTEQLQGAYEMWQKAKAGLEIAEKSYGRVDRLFKEGVMSAQKRDEAYADFQAMKATERAAQSQYQMARNGAQREDKEAAAAQVAQAKGAIAEVNSYIDETVLRAQMDGEVSEIFPKVGELVGTGAPIMNITMLDDRWATFNVREDLLKELTVGKTFTAYVPAFNKDIELKVTYMKDRGTYAAWKATKTTGQFDLKTFEVRAVPVNAKEALRPGMSVIIKR